MKEETKKVLAGNNVAKPEHPPVKQSSGDKHFDDAIDKMLKKPVYIAPGK